MSATGEFASRPGTAFVTGGSGGIGAAVCRLLVSRGSNVVFTYRDPTRGNLVLRELEGTGSAVAAVELDLTDDEAVGDAVRGVVANHGGIHTLVHAAGPLVRQVHLSRVPPSSLRDHLDLEVVALHSVVHSALESLRETRGSIVAVTTAATLRFAVRDGLSAVPKAGVEALIRGLAVEEGRFGVRANSVGPGMLDDGMAQRLRSAGDLDARALEAARHSTPLGRFGRAVDIAEAVCFLASDRANFISGQHLKVDGGYSA